MAKNKYMTGFCSSGLHEGTKPRGVSGRPLKVCGFNETCGCECHTKIDKMHELTGTPRVVYQNPEYEAPISHFVMPRPEDIFNRATVDEATKPVPVNRNPLDDAPSKHFDATPTGKRARGQLEDEVLAVCSSFMRGELPYEFLLAKNVAMEIDKFDPPSVGAIGAVFDRWVSLGFAKCEKRPVRFVSFTVDGMIKGLDALKAQAKHEAKIKAAAGNRVQIRSKNNG